VRSAAAGAAPPREQGGRVILYLEQEAAGLGLANKMRAYQLRDAGLDTIDANSALASMMKSATYGVAVRMLQILGVSAEAFDPTMASSTGSPQAGIEVTAAFALHGAGHCRQPARYLTAKATRAGPQARSLRRRVGEPVDAADGSIGR